MSKDQQQRKLGGGAFSQGNSYHKNNHNDHSVPVVSAFPVEEDEDDMIGSGYEYFVRRIPKLS